MSGMIPMGTKAKAVAELNVKGDFPILKRSVRGRPIVYVDSAATSQKPKAVIDAIADYYKKYNANVHRAVYDLGEEATREYEGAREKLAAFIGAKDAREVVFTRGTTESLNALAYAWGIKGPIAKGDEIVTTIMEHHSNTIPWYFVQDMKGAKIKWVDIHDDGTLKMEQYDDLVTDKTKIVTVTHVSNVLGTINPIKEIAEIAHDHGAICVVDGAQSAPHLPVNVQAWDADGGFLWSVGERGSDLGEFRLPGDVAVDGSGLWFATDFDNGRVQVFGADNEPLGEWAIPAIEQTGPGYSITAAENGRLYVNLPFGDAIAVIEYLGS